MAHMTFGKRLQKYRIENDLTLPQLSEITGKASGYLSEVEREERIPNLRTKYQLNKKLNLGWVPHYERKTA